jgi:3-deoxy-D-manno-octulosonate 8-phosphate phosphatase (KDO 8-P phosphatase)
MRSVGLAIAVSDAAEEVRAGSAYVTQTRGGQGAVREAIDVILKAKGVWEDIVGKYIGS